MAILSIIILNFNTKKLTLDSVNSIEKNYLQEVKEGTFEVIVVDNGSSDESLAAFNEYKKSTKIKSFQIVDSGGNIGFSAGNNKGVKKANGKYVLFLNPDTVVFPKTLNTCLELMESHPEVGASSCKLVNKEGRFDFNSHRGFPTAWNAFCYFSKIQKIFPKSRLFAGYTQGWKNISTNHEVDAISGAFLLVSKKVGEKIGWWDEDYFFYGEDLQFCYDIKKLGLKIYFLGEVESMHIGGASSGIKKTAQDVTTADIERKRKVQIARFEAMKIFYKKNYKNKYPTWFRFIIFAGINLLQKQALAKISVN